jgi:hypothetical protein
MKFTIVELRRFLLVSINVANEMANQWGGGHRIIS